MATYANDIKTTVCFDITHNSDHLGGADIQADNHISAYCFTHSW
jgi:hypothetical protein